MYYPYHYKVRPVWFRPTAYHFRRNSKSILDLNKTRRNVNITCKWNRCVRWFYVLIRMCLCRRNWFPFRDRVSRTPVCHWPESEMAYNRAWKSLSISNWNRIFVCESSDYHKRTSSHHSDKQYNLVNWIDIGRCRTNQLFSKDWIQDRPSLFYCQLCTCKCSPYSMTSHLRLWNIDH